MRRFIFSDNIDKLPREIYDVVIIGSGVAGLYTALNLDDDLKCIILSKRDEKVSSSWFAQGGIAAVTKKSDNTELHIKDTLIAGAGHCNVDAVTTLVSEGPIEIKRLLTFGVPFDKNAQGDIETGREGGHSINRILHCGGDATGKQVTEKLFELVSVKKNLTLRKGVFLSDILTENDKTIGTIIFDGEFKLILCPNIIICTGGIGQVYKNTTNPVISTGDGIAAAKRAGAEICDMEFVQFHPTAFFYSNENGQHFLISEAVRGEGGILRNKNGERFMLGIHPLNELAPRDIVARAIFSEMKKTNTDHVYLDITHLSREFLKNRFATIFEECLKYDIDISKDYIPVIPVQHYFMGGIKTDLFGMTSIDGLYSCGESACTGVHGANRLASNSLLECLVFGRRCARKISEIRSELPLINLNSIYSSAKLGKDKIDIAKIKLEIKETMLKSGGIVRNCEDLIEGIAKINQIKTQLEKHCLNTPEEIEAFNMALVALDILNSALNRKESIGAHFRLDYLYNE